MIKKEQTQWQDDGTVLSLLPWAWCKAQCHEPESTAEYFHQAPPDSPPHTLAGLGKAYTQGMPFCPVILDGKKMWPPNASLQFAWCATSCQLKFGVRRLKPLGCGSVDEYRGSHTGVRLYECSRSKLHLLLLWRNVWLGFSNVINVN